MVGRLAIEGGVEEVARVGRWVSRVPLSFNSEKRPGVLVMDAEGAFDGVVCNTLESFMEADDSSLCWNDQSDRYRW